MPTWRYGILTDQRLRVLRECNGATIEEITRRIHKRNRDLQVTIALRHLLRYGHAWSERIAYNSMLWHRTERGDLALKIAHTVCTTVRADGITFRRGTVMHVLREFTREDQEGLFYSIGYDDGTPVIGCISAELVRIEDHSKDPASVSTAS